MERVYNVFVNRTNALVSVTAFFLYNWKHILIYLVPVRIIHSELEEKAIAENAPSAP